MTEEQLTEEDQEVIQATKELADLLKELDIQVDYFIHDWKAKSEHILDIAMFFQKHPGWIPYFFDNDYDFKDGSGDDVITILTSKPIPQEHAEDIANRIYNLGADPPEIEEPTK